VKCCPRKRDKGVEPEVNNPLYITWEYHVVFKMERLKTGEGKLMIYKIQYEQF